jgi:hypothetical protein
VTAIEAIVTVCSVKIHREQDAGWALAEMATEAFASSFVGIERTPLWLK